MTERKKTQYVKPLLTIAVPIILSNIISQVQMLIDRAFLGHMNKMYMKRKILSYQRILLLVIWQ